MTLIVCVFECVCVCVRACVRACAHACVCLGEGLYHRHGTAHTMAVRIVLGTEVNKVQVRFLARTTDPDPRCQQHSNWIDCMYAEFSSAPADVKQPTWTLSRTSWQFKIRAHSNVERLSNAAISVTVKVAVSLICFNSLSFSFPFSFLSFRFSSFFR